MYALETVTYSKKKIVLWSNREEWQVYRLLIPIGTRRTVYQTGDRNSQCPRTQNIYNKELDPRNWILGIVSKQNYTVPYALRTTSILFLNEISVVLNITCKTYSLINSTFSVCPAVLAIFTNIWVYGISLYPNTQERIRIGTVCVTKK